MKISMTFVLALAASTLLAEPARPTEFQSAKVIQTVEPIFPESLVAVSRNGGRARIVLSVTAEGRLNDWLIVSYTRREFAEAAVYALKKWQFEPARLRGEAVPVSIELTFNFEIKGVVVSLTPTDVVDAMMNSMLNGADAYGPCSLRELDRIPIPINAVRPFYPDALADRGVSGDVTVSFYIDEKGAVRMPYIRGQPNFALAELAVEAVRQWKFEPPTHHGQPVLVHAQQLFRFSRAAAPKGGG